MTALWCVKGVDRAYYVGQDFELSRPVFTANKANAKQLNFAAAEELAKALESVWTVSIVSAEARTGS